MVNERFLHADDAGTTADGAVLAGGLPVPLRGGAVGPRSVGVFTVKGAEEVPLQVAAADPGAAGEVPGLAPVEVHLGDSIDAERAPADLPL